MAAFDYQALDDAGRTQRGIATGDSARQVRQSLREQGLVPVSVLEVRARPAGQSRLPWRRRAIPVRELAVITRQFATLVGAGLTVEESLAALVGQAEHHEARRVLGGVRARVVEGAALADAVGDFPDAFPEIYRASLFAGEQSGRLDLVLERLADYAENTQDLRERVTQALIYPAFLAMVSVAIVLLLFTYVVPQVAHVFQDSGQKLPLLTRVFIGMSGFLREWGLWLLAGVIAVAFGARALLRIHGVRYAVHAMALRVPFIRRLVRTLNATRMARTLSIMVGSGVPLLSAMAAAGGVTGNLVMRAALEQAAEEVGSGVSLSRALGRSGHFPPLLVQMIASGEASGRLAQMLDKSAQTHERELSHRLAMMVSYFEPLMILVMGGIVFLIILAILLPIFQLNQLIG